ncbi:hypothetical protein [Desulfovibrio fairfieldensis]|uniref:Uncharacterized protein n=1 Tax=Desulfovibrio fairfieldensis TaxID=44742 RepID=A0A0X8JIV5_9BACT|nr:hypothetical protein [Desulfovibrio fairfieldensis]AMD89462.1 hypothetical protein AXF13_04675 [Desulfovibrio fairfieldensis]
MNADAVRDCLEIIGNGTAIRGEQALYRLAEAMQEARCKHPVFADGIYQALGRVGAEYGELVQAVEKLESPERVETEALHLLVTTVRLLNKEYEPHEEEGMR